MRRRRTCKALLTYYAEHYILRSTVLLMYPTKSAQTISDSLVTTLPAGGNVRVEVSKHILLTYYAEEEVVQSLTNLLCGALHIAEHCAVDVSYKISTNYIRLIGYNTSSRWECQSRSEQTHITYLLCGAVC